MESREDVQRAMREMIDELGKVADQARKMTKQIAEDVGGYVGIPEKLRLSRSQSATAAQTIRELAALHADGLITDAEYASKKAELLERM